MVNFAKNMQFIRDNRREISFSYDGLTVIFSYMHKKRAFLDFHQETLNGYDSVLASRRGKGSGNAFALILIAAMKTLRYNMHRCKEQIQICLLVMP